MVQGILNQKYNTRIWFNEIVDDFINKAPFVWIDRLKWHSVHNVRKMAINDRGMTRKKAITIRGIDSSRFRK